MKHGLSSLIYITCTSVISTDHIIMNFWFLETGGDTDFQANSLLKIEQGLLIILHYLNGSELKDLFAKSL